MATQDQNIDSLAVLLKDILAAKNQDTNIVELSYLKFNGDIEGKGLIWTGSGHTKQFVYQPGQFFSSESIVLAKDKTFAIDGIEVLSDKALGASVTKSNLREVGKLKGLVIDGGLSVNSYLFFNATADRLGLGTDQPNAAFSIADEGVELVLGSRESTKGGIGTFNSADLELVTDNTARLIIKAGGDIELGNRNNGPIKVTVNGTLGINVGTADPRSSLHVGGAIKFNDTLHLKGRDVPNSGSYNQGDIVWNSNPQPRGFVGWICTKGGNPGMWNPFGEIK
jgi:hypothetical protein